MPIVFPITDRQVIANPSLNYPRNHDDIDNVDSEEMFEGLGWGFKNIFKAVTAPAKAAVKVGKVAAKTAVKVGKVAAKTAVKTGKVAVKTAAKVNIKKVGLLAARGTAAYFTVGASEAALAQAAMLKKTAGGVMNAPGAAEQAVYQDAVAEAKIATTPDAKAAAAKKVAAAKALADKAKGSAPQTMMAGISPTVMIIGAVGIAAIGIGIIVSMKRRN